ncbi:hypothetical protein T12_11652 [Trichinella patagoniensis]|uniref:Uncharacterized protein n=1 Tax=Trichinella patagoniensis TaxID=990121 RepID=A0A0V0YTZ5_9BILA|nr:hypothetical protein T12_11652 [Trichinella patagoniensis]
MNVNSDIYVKNLPYSVQRPVKLARQAGRVVGLYLPFFLANR